MGRTVWQTGASSLRSMPFVNSVAARWKAVRLKVRKRQVAFVSVVQTKLACERGQGTTEYAILVGVLVVIAILAITVFKPKIQSLWDAISSGIQGL